ncbi:MAG TPA: methyltransferase domain-containing protein [Gemmatimonadaceae bacterium]|nr:methyltransferase domain-containing protein [Gemmatimonadaceae bacterium]
MHTRELGLVLARQLGSVEDLHYGLWDNGLELTFGNLRRAQQRYSDHLIAQLPPADGRVRILDIGCGTGHLMRQLLDRGYAVDGVIPARALGALVREKLRPCDAYQPRIFECRFEAFPADEHAGAYDVALFSESFQYIPMTASLPIVHRILKPGGMLLIADVFKSDAHGDAGPGDRSISGGHVLREFYERMRDTAFELLKDEDLTSRVSPNLDLVNDFLMQRARPAALTLHRFLESNYPVTTRLALRLFRRRIEKLHYKYFCGHRCGATFERYKRYRLLVYRLGCGSPANGAAAHAGGLAS